MSLASRTALVTGSTSGIGLAIARALAAQGASIVFLCSDAASQITGTNIQVDGGWTAQ